ncbi:MAG: TlpA family protein disulfide reductase [Candidatus Magasanikbacteria bacterium]|nr:TlpA family protein disulfide reductase [Candidatus Magasanikbacteria bacterium]
MSKIFFITTFFTVSVIMGAGCKPVVSTPPSAATPTSETTKSTAIPDLVLKDYSGKDVSLRGLVGKTLVINSWASWCPFCKNELPDFITLQKEFGEKILVIAINRGESLEIAREYTDRLAGLGNVLYLLDPDDSFYRGIGAFSMPETIFVDVRGDITDHKRGPMELEEMRAKVKKLIP